MRKYLKLAILVEVLALVMAVAYLIGFFTVGLGRDRAMLNIALVLSGVSLAGLLLFILWQRTLQREAIVRRFYVSPDWIYNHEIGYAPMSRIVPDGNAFDFVTFAAEALARMSYGFEIADAPTSFEPKVIIKSIVFLYHTADDEDGSDGGVVVDAWEGILSKVEDPTAGDESYVDVASFSNAGELARLLEETGIMAPHEQGDDVD